MMVPKHVLVADGDRAMRSTLRAVLESEGMFRVTEARSAAEASALTLSRDQRFDAILLDLNLPDAEGSELCFRLRRAGLRAPIVIVTAQSDEQDVVQGLDAGANDYVLKPFRVAELLARLRAQIRAYEASEDAVLLVGPYHFRPGARTLFDPVENRRIRLTDKETAVLKFLYRCGTTPVGRQVLLREVWGYSSGASTHTVETHIYRLRRKIEADPANARILVNEEGGYRLGHHRRGAMPIPASLLTHIDLGAPA